VANFIRSVIATPSAAPSALPRSYHRSAPMIVEEIIDPQPPSSLPHVTPGAAGTHPVPVQAPPATPSAVPPRAAVHPHTPTPTPTAAPTRPPPHTHTFPSPRTVPPPRGVRRHPSGAVPTSSATSASSGHYVPPHGRPTQQSAQPTYPFGGRAGPTSAGTHTANGNGRYRYGASNTLPRWVGSVLHNTLLW